MPAARRHSRAPSDAGRNVVRVQITMLPADLAELDALAGRLSEPGMAGNRSATFRVVLREYLNAEADRDRGRAPGRRTMRD